MRLETHISDPWKRLHPVTGLTLNHVPRPNEEIYGDLPVNGGGFEHVKCLVTGIKKIRRKIVVTLEVERPAPETLVECDQCGATYNSENDHEKVVCRVCGATIS